MGAQFSPMLIFIVFGTHRWGCVTLASASPMAGALHGIGSSYTGSRGDSRTRQREPLEVPHRLAAASTADTRRLAASTPGPDTCTRYIHKDPHAGNGTFTWLSTEAVRQMAQAVPGHRARLRAALGRFMESENLTVAFIGGSITAGQGAVDGMAFPFWAEAAMHAAMGDKVNVKNGAVPGTLSSYMSVCHNVHVAQEADVIFVDYTLNDPHDAHPIMENPIRRAFERLLRKLLNYPK